MSEISELIEKMYGHYYTPQTISNRSKLVSEDVLTFKERPLETRYSVIFMDVTHIPSGRSAKTRWCYLSSIMDLHTKKILAIPVPKE